MFLKIKKLYSNMKSKSLLWMKYLIERSQKMDSQLKLSCIILNKELSTVKEKNSCLNEKINELKSTISSILQRTITKEEMKEMIKEGLTPIIDILLGEKTLERKEEIIQSEDLNSAVLSLTKTEDNRIASGGEDGNISISSYNLNEKKWKRDIHKKKAHEDCVSSLCNLNNNRLLSGSSDYSIKVWTISDADLKLIRELKEKHTNDVTQVIPLSKERFASCSWDNTVKIWKDDETYERISTLEHDDWIGSILQLRGKEVLVSCGDNSSTGVTFWDLNNYTKQHNIEGYSVIHSSHMIELSDGNIAISSKNEPYPIIIIDSNSYQVKKEIQSKELIIGCSSLCMFDKNSFIYVYEGAFLQISNEDFSILYNSQGGKFKGYRSIISLEGGYFAIENGKRISIINLYNN